MAKSLLHRLFGIGSVPGSQLPALREEGLVLVEEGIRGSVTYLNYRAPGRYSWRRRSWFVGSLVVTQQRFAAFAFSRPIVNVPLKAEYLAKIRCELESDSRLLITFDAGAFNAAASGTVECRFVTPKARLFIDQIGARAT